jgi:hypothetical protein
MWLCLILVLIGYHELSRQAAAAAEIPGSQFQVGAWYGAANTSHSTGLFSFCLVSGVYESGTRLGFALDVSGAFALVLANDRWRLTPDAQYPVQVWVDRTTPTSMTATALDGGMVHIPLPTTAAAFQLLQRGAVLYVRAAGSLMQYRLDRSSAAIARLRACWGAYSGGSAPSNPFESRSGPLASTPSNPFAARRESDSFDPVEFIRLLFRHPRLATYRIVPRAELPEEFRMYPIAWTSQGAVGTLTRAVEIPDGGIDTLAALVLADDRRGCRGEFASGSRTENVIPSMPVTRAFTACRHGDETAYAHYAFIPLGDGRCVRLAHVSLTSDRARAAEQSILDVMREIASSRRN